ncbi:heme-binding domain-containing protein [Deinococcus wulumuqiensis]|uniref:heme-binding domain-containing protein n=1 Tax=Deinococcus wulumuqiensis TaxID=980427 RepID=UPI000684B34A|nr:heme-binding domain-containing protein [Deinococcus wulumuqiensis]QII21769.1 heme-binding domain-containing protein [Deinococcus wulumuqiensis R12]
MFLSAAFVLAQLVPYGRAHANPPAQAGPQWDSPQTQALFDRACADCHSNQTRWPWYSSVAPVSWLVQKHVDEGRSKFNVNVPGFGREADEAAGQVRSGEMPEKTYLPLHPEARLTATERDQLVRGLAATFGAEGGTERGDGDGD